MGRAIGHYLFSLADRLIAQVVHSDILLDIIATTLQGDITRQVGQIKSPLAVSQSRPSVFNSPDQTRHHGAATAFAFRLGTYRTSPWHHQQPEVERLQRHRGHAKREIIGQRGIQNAAEYHWVIEGPLPGDNLIVENQEKKKKNNGQSGN